MILDDDLATPCDHARFLAAELAIRVPFGTDTSSGSS
jgi:hypothetical protein